MAKYILKKSEKRAKNKMLFAGLYYFFNPLDAEL